jgi:hypothetical protein
MPTHCPRAPILLPREEAKEVHVLWCFTQRDSTAFEVIAHVDASISQLKKLVWEERKNGVFRDTDATDLMLWKVGDEWLANNAQLTS